MEFDGCRQESYSHFVVQAQSPADQVCSELLHWAGKAACHQVLAKDVGVDGGQSLIIWEADSKHTEVALHTKLIKLIKIFAWVVYCFAISILFSSTRFLQI